MKKYLALFLAAAMAASTMAVPVKAEEIDTSAYEALDEVELIGADSTGKGAAGQIFGEYVASRVEELTGGKLTIDYHPNGDLGGDADLIRQMQSNDIQIVVCQTAPTVSFIPENAVFDLPMVFAKYDGDKIDSVLNGENDFTAALSAAYEAQRAALPVEKDRSPVPEQYCKAGYHTRSSNCFAGFSGRSFFPGPAGHRKQPGPDRFGRCGCCGKGLCFYHADPGCLYAGNGSFCSPEYRRK